MRRALRRARDGVALDPGEAAILLAARGDALADLCASAARVRDRGLASAGRPGVVTFSPKVFIPLTRLCRDRCHYCTFVTVPGKLAAPYLSPDEVLAIARAGQSAGCKEALFTLGDRPEDRWPAARAWLDENGYDSTLSYLRAMAVRVLEETGLLPHLNPGVLSWQELQRLKPVAPSMGMMLETSARRLWSEPGGPHYGSPDKEPAVRMRTLEDAGRLNVAFTTGLLVGIGETMQERADTIFAIRRVARAYGHVQEVIVQGFRAKADTAMRHVPDLTRDELLAAVAVTRLVLGPGARVQSPPNLVDRGDVPALLAAGIDDFGGVSPVTADHVNPERPWPAVDALATASRRAGFELAERLTAYPGYLDEPWLDPRLRPHVAALAGADGLARPGRGGPGPAVAGTRRWARRSRAHRTARRNRSHGPPPRPPRRLRRRLRRLGAASCRGRRSPPAPSAPPLRLDGEVRTALRHAATRPGRLGDRDALVLFDADGPSLEALCSLADDLRRDVVGEDVTYVVNRNINFTNVCYTGCRFCAFAQRRGDADAYTLSLDQVGERAEEAWAAGATEVCMQGGIHPDLPGTAYFDIAAEVKRRVPGMHVHAFSPMEVVNGAARTGLSIRDWLAAAREAGVDSVPGTAAEILDDDVRWVLTKGKLPASSWIEVITTAHSVGLRSSSTMMYGHVDAPRHWLAHLRVLRCIQDETGGFTEFVALPFVHHNAPLYLAGVARPGPTVRENRVVHAMARLLLHGSIGNIQCSWVKLGVDGCRQVLAGGANDLGGTLMEETISRMAGSQHGSRKSVAELEAIASAAGRPARERTTLYGVPTPRAGRQFLEVGSRNPPKRR